MITPFRTLFPWAALASGAMTLACTPELPPGLGDELPDARLSLVETSGSPWSVGHLLNLSELEGKPIVLDFWASWCGPCRAQHRHVTELKKRYGDQIVVIGVLWNDDPESAREWLEREGATYPTFEDVDEQLSDALWINALPRFTLLTPDRRLSWDYLGMASAQNSWSTDSVEVRIQAMLSGR